MQMKSKGDAIPDRQAGLPRRGYLGCSSAECPRLFIYARDLSDESVEHDEWY